MPCIHTDCNNINQFGYCQLTACSNPKYNGSGTYTITADVVPRADYDKIKAEYIMVLKRYCHNICDFCQNNIVCKGKDCEKFISGVGDATGKYPDFKWTCEGFDYGTCPMMENTPCHECLENDCKGFELRGAQGEG